MVTRTPVLILGAGPAGLSTALHLQQLDPTWTERLLVVDRAVHPRPKLCGGGVTRLGLQLLKDLGLPDPLPIPHTRVRDARFLYRRRTVHVRGDPEFLVFHRQEFDHFLAGTARQRGITIRENTRIRALARSADGIEVSTGQAVFHARVVVGADGSRGVTRRFVQGLRSPLRTSRLLETIQPARPDSPPFSRETATFDFTPVADSLQGYMWDFPAKIRAQPHHNRGIYDARVARSRPRASLPGILQPALAAMGSDGEHAHLEGHPIHWFSPRSRLAAPHILLVGDAAGAEPLFGEGIAPALAYGKIAAAAIHQAFQSGRFSFQDYKRRVLFSQLGAYLLLRWWVAWWAYHLSYSNTFMHAMWTAGGILAALRNMGTRNR